MTWLQEATIMLERLQSHLPEDALNRLQKNVASWQKASVSSEAATASPASSVVFLRRSKGLPVSLDPFYFSLEEISYDDF